MRLFRIFIQTCLIIYASCFLSFATEEEVLKSVEKKHETHPGFKVGELFRYSFHWGIVPVGHFEMSSEWIEEDGKKILRLHGRAKTLKWVSKIYHVDDEFESLVDPDTFLPQVYFQNIHEGRKIRKDTIRFSHKEGKAYWESGLSGQKKEIIIGDDTRDVLTLVYKMRVEGMTPDEERNFMVLVDNKLYDLKVKAIQTEKLDNKLIRKAKCIKIEPIAKFGEVFVRKGRIHLWFLEDERRWCMKVIFYLKIANFSAELESVVEL